MERPIRLLDQNANRPDTSNRIIAIVDDSKHTECLDLAKHLLNCSHVGWCARSSGVYAYTTRCVSI